MRILMLNYEFPPIGGGAGNATYYLLREFSKMNIQIDLVTSSKDKYREEKFSKNINIYKLSVGKKDIHYWTAKEALIYTFKALNFSKKLIRKNKYDLVHGFFALPTGIVASKLNLPYLISLRGSDVPGFNSRFSQIEGIQKLFFNNICKNAKKVIANSQGLKELASNSFKGNIDIIHNGIDTIEFSQKKKKEKLIICVARLIERKGIDYLIEAMPRVNKDYKLLIIGEGPQKNELVKQAKSNNTLNRIKFLDYVKHDGLPNYYGKSMIFVLPSLYEGMSNTVLEAMSCGLPIVTTNTGGTNELIRENGIIIEKKSSLSIANALNILIINEKLRKEFSENSRKIALTMSWPNISIQYFNKYKEIINE